MTTIKRKLDNIKADELKEFEYLFCKDGEFFSIHIDKYSQIKYTFIERKKTTLPAPQKMIKWLKQKGFEV